MSAAAAATETIQRCGSIDPVGTALRIDRLRKEVLSHNAKLIAWAVYRHMDDIQRSGVGDEIDETFKGTAADAKWARLFLARIQQRMEGEDSRWMFQHYDVQHNADDTIQITYDVMERANTIQGVNNWIVGLVDASNAAETEIVAIQQARAGNEADLLRMWCADHAAEEAEVRASGTTINA